MRISLLLNFIILFLFQSISSVSISQQEQLNFIKNFNEFHQDLPRERIYISTDRQWYYYNDFIWFSAFVNTGSQFENINLSNVLYVELIDPRGNVIDRAITRVNMGRGAGMLSFAEGREIGGTYKIKAYTLWSLNFEETYIYNKELEIILPENGITKSEETLVVDVQFLPEGGHLVAGLPSRVGFKAIDSEGRGVDFTGQIMDSFGNLISDIETDFSGMGNFEFTPSHGQNYIARVDEEEYSLPEVLENGYNLRVDTINDQFVINLKSTAPLDFENYMIFGHVRGSVYFASRFIETNNGGLALSSSEIFPTGVVHFTVLDPNGNPILERLIFNKNQQDDISTSISLNEELFGLREEVEVALQSLNQNNVQVRNTSALTVFDDTLNDYNPYASNIITQYYLETDLIGHVENPGYYFHDESENIDKKLDNLMLTQGWRAFDIQQLGEVEEIEILSYPETGISISGTIRSDFWGRKLEEANVAYFISQDDSGDDDVFLTTTDSHGRFLIEGLDFEGNKQLTIRATNFRGRDWVRIYIEDPFYLLPESTQLPIQSILDEFVDSSLDQDRVDASQVDIFNQIDTQMSVLLDEVVVTATRTEEMDYRTRAAELRDSQVINLDEKPHFLDMPITILLGQIPGVRIRGFDGISVATGSNVPTLIIIDGIPTDVAFLLQMSVFDIQSIRVYRRANETALWGSLGSGGVIQVTTRSGLGPSPPTQGLLRTFIEGYQLPVEFYSPRYGFQASASETPDSRITLHWEPLLEYDRGQSPIIFWTNDFPGDYRIVWEGITIEGKPFYHTQVFEIQE